MHLHETATRTALIAARSRVVAPPPPTSTADAGAVNPTEDQVRGAIARKEPPSDRRATQIVVIYVVRGSQRF